MRKLTITALATLTLTGCVPAMIAAEVAAEAYLVYLEGSDIEEVRASDLTWEECQRRADRLNAIAEERGDPFAYECVVDME
jgi:hypothetical protein